MIVALASRPQWYSVLVSPSARGSAFPLSMHGFLVCPTVGVPSQSKIPCLPSPSPSTKAASCIKFTHPLALLRPCHVRSTLPVYSNPSIALRQLLRTIIPLLAGVPRVADSEALVCPREFPLRHRAPESPPSRKSPHDSSH